MENKVIYMNNGLTEDEKDILCKFAFCFGLTDEDVELMLENKKVAIVSQRLPPQFRVK